MSNVGDIPDILAETNQAWQERTRGDPMDLLQLGKCGVLREMKQRERERECKLKRKRAEIR